MAYQSVSDVLGTFFEVLVRRKGQKLIFFGRVKSKPMIREDPKSKNEPPQFSHYEPNVLKMMENMRYGLTSGPNLNFGKGRQTLRDLLFQKGKPLTIITELGGDWAMC